MSMNGMLERIPATDLDQLLQRLRRNAGALREYWDAAREQQGKPPRLNLHTMWHGLHFLGALIGNRGFHRGFCFRLDWLFPRSARDSSACAATSSRLYRGTPPAVLRRGPSISA